MINNNNSLNKYNNNDFSKQIIENNDNLNNINNINYQSIKNNMNIIIYNNNKSPNVKKIFNYQNNNMKKGNVWTQKLLNSEKRKTNEIIFRNNNNELNHYHKRKNYNFLITNYSNKIISSNDKAYNYANQYQKINNNHLNEKRLNFNHSENNISLNKNKFIVNNTYNSPLLKNKNIIRKIPLSSNIYKNKKSKLIKQKILVI